MAKVLVLGGGVVGLSTALLLARDGHDVTVIERDPAPPPTSADEAWASWERQGVNQFRMGHYFLPRFRQELDTHLPEVRAQAEALGATRVNQVERLPAFAGPLRPGDERYDAITARRPVMETALALVAATTDGLEIRRGVAVAGLAVGTPALDGVPHVTGVVTDGGATLSADLVVDVTGRRSPLPRWLEAVGGTAPAEERADSGMIYYGRHYRSTPDTPLEMRVPGLMPAGSVAVLSLPADNDTWALVLAALAGDAELRGLRDPARFTAAWRALPDHAHFMDGEPIEDDVAAMAKIEDRHRSFVVDGRPVATGVLAVGDAWACTNPTIGRGASIGFLHALELRALLAGDPLADPVATVMAFDEATRANVEPWYRATVDLDVSRRAAMQAEIDGTTYESDDPNWEMGQAFGYGHLRDPDLYRAMAEVGSMLMGVDDVFAQPGVFERTIEVGADWRDAEHTGPTRAELVAIANG